MESRGRGRGYGRARGQAAGQPQQPQHRPGGPQRPPQQRPQQAGRDTRPPGAPAPAWVRPAQPPQPAAAAPVWPRHQTGQAAQPRPPPQQQRPPHPQAQAAQAQPPQAALGRGGRESEGAVPKRIVGQGEGEGNDTPGAAAGGRGGSSVRGRVVEKREILYTRPPSVKNSKKGASGSPIKLLANYLPLEHSPKWSLFQYRVDMAPDIDDTRKRKLLFRDATQEVLRGGYLFDGTVLCITHQLPNEPTELFVKDGEETVRITIKLVGDIAWGDAHYLQLFNILIRKCLHLMGLQLVGRNYYMPEAEVRLEEHKVQLWPGYFTSMRQHEERILLNVDLMFKFMRTDNVYDLLLECMSTDRDGRAEFQRRVIGCVVLSTYNNKTYKIDDVDWGSTPVSSFKMKDGTEVTYKNYFAQKHKARILVDDQPMLVSRSKPREIRAGMSEIVYLVPELCTMTGLTDKQRENFNLMKALATHTRIGVEGRIRKLKEFSDKIHSRPEVVQEIRRWDLNIGRELVKLDGRVLGAETIYGGNGTKYSAGTQADWTRELRVKPMLYAPTMERLAVICTVKQKSGAQEFMQLLSKTAQGMHWSIGNPRYFETSDYRAGGYLEQVDRCVTNAVKPTMILCILPNNSQDRYSAIKKKCYVDKGIPTQMFLEKNLRSKGVMSIATKVAIQMNCKIGGAPWSVSVPLSHLMVIGYDVCRDTANKKKSFSGMVASLDRHLSRYFNMSVPHELEQELSDNFATFVVLACKKYKEVNERYPDRIVIYRDGVGAGQLPYVYNHEVVEIKRRLKEEIYRDPEELKMAFIVVSKRINTRIMTAKENPPPGTVVDSVITLPERYDFYIVSQCVRQGTVAPTNYNVIEDTVGLPPDRIQMLTFKLTHMYYNWSGTVRVPAPCQLAHKLSFMVSQNLHRSAHCDLENVLYYL